MARPQKNVLQENEQIAALLRKLEKKLTALTDQVSLIEHNIDGARLRDEERKNSIEVRALRSQDSKWMIYSRVWSLEKRHVLI